MVGTGPVGMRLVGELLERNARRPIILYGGEPWEPYNRVRLSSLLSGDVSLDSIQNPLSMDRVETVIQRHNCPIVRIDRDNRQVIDALGYVQAYSELVLATGSSPHIPIIPGVNKKGVFTFRDLNDTRELMARRIRSRRTVVLGGGLLGLEAARGLQYANTEVLVIDHSNTLMARQLDEEAAEILREEVLAMGIQVLLNTGIQEVLGGSEIEGVRLRNGRTIACDTLVLATGIKPNIQLALAAGISVGRGIRVDDQLRTSDPHVYAVGECAEHKGNIYGLVVPGLEQAAVLAHNLTGGEGNYQGSLNASRLKVLGKTVISIGRTGLDEPQSQLQWKIHSDPSRKLYRKLLLDRGQLVGAMAIGEWPEINRIQEAVTRRQRIWPWQWSGFISTGTLWSETQRDNVAQWPVKATVCQCTGVTRGTLTQAKNNGCGSIADLARCTGASTVCGSCKPLLQDLLGSDQAPVAEKGSRYLQWAAMLGILLSLAFLLLPNLPYSRSVQSSFSWDFLWRDSLFKQISGYTLLALGVLISLISLRKRVSRVRWGEYSSWRVIHVVLGVLTAIILLAHTGLRLGNNLNFSLMLGFVMLMLMGSIASGGIGLQHRVNASWARRIQELSKKSHLYLLWPIPSLLGFHVLKTYWF